MPTHADLRDAFRDLEQQADEHPLPDLAHRARAARARRGRRRRAGLLLSAGSLVAAATAIVLVVTSAGGDAHRHTATGPSVTVPTMSPSATPAATFRPTSALTPALAPASFSPTSFAWFLTSTPGFAVHGSATFTDLFQYELDGTDGSHYDLTAYAAGGFEPVRQSDAKAVDVTVRSTVVSGFYGTLENLPLGVSAADPVGLAWKYAPNAWATLVSWDKASVPLGTATSLAGALQPAPRALTVPVSSPALPKGLVLQGVLNSVASPRAGQHGTNAFSSLVDYAVSNPTTGTVLSIAVGPRDSSTPTGKHLRIDGRDAYASATAVDIVGADFVAGVSQLPLQPSGTYLLTPSELIDIARHLRFPTHVATTASWFEAGTALR